MPAARNISAVFSFASSRVRLSSSLAVLALSAGGPALFGHVYARWHSSGCSGSRPRHRCGYGGPFVVQRFSVHYRFQNRRFRFRPCADHVPQPRDPLFACLGPRSLHCLLQCCSRLCCRLLQSPAFVGCQNCCRDCGAQFVCLVARHLWEQWIQQPVPQSHSVDAARAFLVRSGAVEQISCCFIPDGLDLDQRLFGLVDHVERFAGRGAPAACGGQRCGDCGCGDGRLHGVLLGGRGGCAPVDTGWRFVFRCRGCGGVVSAHPFCRRAAERSGVRRAVGLAAHSSMVRAGYPLSRV